MIGDDATVGAGVSLQTHLFEDRVMKMSTVRVEDGAIGWVGERDAAQWPPTGTPARGWLRSYSARRTGFERIAQAALIRRIRSAASSAPSCRSG